MTLAPAIASQPHWPPDAIGVTTSIPIEVPLAAGRRIVDLNNIFITAAAPEEYVRKAEAAGLPRTCCGWIRGLFGLIRALPIREVVFVTGGDCSNTTALLETLQGSLDRVHTFAYPYPRERAALDRELDRFCDTFGVTRSQAEAAHDRLRGLRRDLAEIDRLTWQERRVSGADNHRWLVSASDFDGDLARFGDEVAAFLATARAAPVRPVRPRVGLLGVPPILGDLHAVLDEIGVDAVYHEIPRQFALTEPGETLLDTWHAFTYPYGVWPRIADIRREAERRGLHGLIHYTQTFCHRQLHDLVIRQEIKLPILTLEGDNPGPVDARTRLRLESFVEMLADHARRSCVHAEGVR